MSMRSEFNPNISRQDHVVSKKEYKKPIEDNEPILELKSNKEEFWEKFRQVVEPPEDKPSESTQNEKHRTPGDKPTEEEKEFWEKFRQVVEKKPSEED